MSADIAHDREYDTEEQRLRQRLGGFRTIVGVPIQSEDHVIAVISLWRRDVNPFTEREIELATTFAAQGAIAIRNASLMQQLDQRTQELGRSVDQLNGLSKVAQAVSSSLDPEEVLSTIVKHAVELSDTEGGSIFEFDDVSQAFQIRTAYGTSEELLEALRATKVGVEDTLVGRAASTGTSLAVPDIGKVPPDNHLRQLARAGWRSMLAVPLVRDDRILGALVVRRRRTGEFSSEIKELLETFASQSALAIQNARLFQTVRKQATELAEWNRELESRVEEQVAEIDRMGRLKRFLSPQLAELIISSGDESFLESHRREITVVFCDLRGFTAFAETTEPEETMTVLRQYHEALGELIFRFEGTLERFTGDGLMVFFNDPSVFGRRYSLGSDGGRDAKRCCGPCRGLASQRARSRFRRRDCARVRNTWASRCRGPLRLRRDRNCHESSVPPLQMPRKLERCSSASVCTPASSISCSRPSSGTYA
jgi:GAF domain-containing protein